MNGHIARKGDRYYVVIDLDRDASTGRRKQKWHPAGKKKKDAEALRARLVNDVNEGRYIEPSKLELKDFISEWLVGIKSTIRPSTWESYRSNMNAHVIPVLGQKQIRRITPSQLNALYQQLLESGRMDGNGGLSSRTVRYVHTILHRALKDAVRWGYLQRNPADMADAPKPVRPEFHVWTGEELRAFLQGVREDRLYPLYLLTATTGMRRGEVLGQRWTDVDLEGAKLHVRQTLVMVGQKPQLSSPKTKQSSRTIPLDPTTVAVLRSYRASQMEERLAWGPAYQETGLLFTREDGSLINPQSLSSAFDRHVRRSGLPSIPFHGLRHSWATIALTSGVNPKVVADRLGHASISITLDTYSHVLPSLGEDAAAKVASVILGSSV